MNKTARLIRLSTTIVIACTLIVLLVGCDELALFYGDSSQSKNQQYDNTLSTEANNNNYASKNDTNWDFLKGKWEYRYTYSVEGQSRTIIEFDLYIDGFDGYFIEGSYTYKVQDKPLFQSWNYSDDGASEIFYAEPKYQYISNLYASNQGRVYDYYVDLYDNTLENSITQPCFIIDKNEGILILTGHEQWNPLRPVKRVD